MCGLSEEAEVWGGTISETMQNPLVGEGNKKNKKKTALLPTTIIPCNDNNDRIILEVVMP